MNSLARILLTASIGLLPLTLPAAPLRIVCLGDSITQGRGDHSHGGAKWTPTFSYRYPLWKLLVDAGADVDFVGSLQGGFEGDPNWADYQGRKFDRDHEGHWGWKTVDVAAKLPGWIQGYTPDVALILLGSNDANGKTPAEQKASVERVRTAMPDIVATLRKKKPKVVILLGQCFQEWAPFPALRTAMIELAQAQTTTESPVTIVDHSPGWVSDPKSPGTHTVDWVHPNSTGDEQLARNWFAAMKPFVAGIRSAAVVSPKPTPRAAPSTGDDWFDFASGQEPEDPASVIDLRFLNETFAGENGAIIAKDGQFLHSANGQVVRFWAVNGPPHDLKGDDLRKCARLLAQYGVNLVRVHGGMFDKNGEADLKKVRHAQEVVAAMKAEGIYSHFSIYFPLWFTPPANLSWLEGYDGKKHPFAALMFNPQFQEKHRAWFKTLLTTPYEQTGKALKDDPAVFGVEIQNEDSLFFWTFSEANLPDPQLRLLEKHFGDWLVKRHGSLENAFAAWKSPQLKRDAPAEGRVAFRPLWNIFNNKSTRDQDTAAFLLEVQTEFYRSTHAYLRSLGFKGLIHASNWATASPEVFGPLEKLSYLAGDFIDRHGYFECNHKGDNAAWSIRAGHTYSDRSALRFDPDEPGQPKRFVHPVMDPQYDDKPSMISETTFTRPNRFRSEAPLYFATYGALQDSDCIVHFAFDSAKWAVKPGFWMQQWTLATPAMLGQFPAAALLYRRGLVAPGSVVANVKLNTTDLATLKGTSLPQDAAFDELRLKDVPSGMEAKAGQRLDPLLHYVGRSHVSFTGEPGGVKASDLNAFINRTAQTVASSTGELKLDYGKGLLVINAPRTQGASGNLASAGTIELPALTLASDLDLAHIIAVPLDDQPLATSGRILLQVMSEEKASGFVTQPAGTGTMRIANPGRDPWQVKMLRGTVGFKRPDANQLKVTALDFSGRETGDAGPATHIELQPTTIYYLIHR